MKIDARLLEALTEQAVEAAPKECCGLLWSRGEQPITRLTPYPGPLYCERFHMQDDWLLREFYQGRQAGFTAKGYYHSHCRCKAVPSSRDLVGHPPGSLCVIVTPSGVARAFRMEEDGFREQTIQPV